MTGPVVSMGLALAVGRGDSPLASLAGQEPLVLGKDVALVGRRDQGQSYGHEALAVSGIIDLTWATMASGGRAFLPNTVDAVSSTILARVARSDLEGVWILVDADMLNPDVLPAVGSPESGGPSIDELALLLAPLVCHPKAFGLARPLYDPSLNPDRSSAAKLMDLLGASLVGG